MNSVFNSILGDNEVAEKPNPKAGEENHNGGNEGEQDKNAATEDGDENKEKGNEGKDNPGGDKATTEDDDDIDDEKLKKILNKRGISVDDLNKLKVVEAEPKPLTDEEKQQQAEQKRKDMLVFGLESGIIKSDSDYHNFIQDLNTPARELAYQEFKAERLEDDAELSEEEIQQEFAELQNEHLEEDDKRRIRSAKKLEKFKADYLSEKYQDIQSLEEEYDEHTSIAKQLSKYNTKVDNIFNEISDELTFDVKDATDSKKTHTYKFKISQEILQSVKDLYKGKSLAPTFSSDGTKDETIKNAILLSIKNKEMDNIINELAHSYASAKIDEIQKGRKGLFPQRETVS